MDRRLYKGRSGDLFDRMIREDDDENRAKLRRQYVMAITMEARESVARYRKGRRLGFEWPRFRNAVDKGRSD